MSGRRKAQRNDQSRTTTLAWMIKLPAITSRQQPAQKRQPIQTKPKPKLKPGVTMPSRPSRLELKRNHWYANGFSDYEVADGP